MTKKTYLYKILQLKNDEALSPLRFRRYAAATAAGCINLNNYNEVYSGQITVDSDCSKSELLEHLFTKFNLFRPADFRGHSLSTSDIISLRADEKGAGEYENHYVDSVGFRNLGTDCTHVLS